MNQKTDISANLPHHEKRFGGVARLYGDQGLARLQKAHVCVIGIGGVGSWAVESLARSAIGQITMIDMDLVAESNINRQLLATTDSLGRDKVAVMSERVHQINPHCLVIAIDEFVDRENIATLIDQQFDYVIDCIDDFRTKAALIHHCKRHNINIITLGGAGGQTDPGKIRQADLSRTQHDVLLAKTRKLLRQDYSFARNPQRSFGIPCIYSDEQLVYPDGTGGLSAQRPAANPGEETTNALSCAGGIGSVTHTTGTFAFFASSFVINRIAHAEQ